MGTRSGGAGTLIRGGDERRLRRRLGQRGDNPLMMFSKPIGPGATVRALVFSQMLCGAAGGAWTPALAASALPQMAAASVAERLPMPTEPLPVPAKDGFYQPPAAAVLQAAASGRIFKVREIKPKAYFWFDVPARAWQLMYRSSDGKGQPVASVTTVLVPFKAPAAPADRILLSYQAAYDALTTACAPSYAITKGAQWEQVFINRALARGWVVAVPDYEGLQSHWGDGLNAARGVLDGVRAAGGLLWWRPGLGLGR
jgi:Secretory lipase